MSSKTKNWNLRPGANSYVPKAEKQRRRNARQEKLERRARIGWTAQNVHASLYWRGRLRK